MNKILKARDGVLPTDVENIAWGTCKKRGTFKGEMKSKETAVKNQKEKGEILYGKFYTDMTDRGQERAGEQQVTYLTRVERIETGTSARKKIGDNK